MSTKRKPNSGRPGGDLTGMQQVRNPSKSIRPLLALLDEVCAATREALHDSGPVAPGYLSFDRAILTRGLNILEAIRVLSVPLHWEAASSSARQMFELILNMEALAAMSDREEGSFRFTLYGLMQRTKARVAEQDYERATGRPLVEEQAAKLKGLLSGAEFEMFKERTRADGTPVWSKSWTGRTAWELAKASPHENRRSQYNQLFVSWSEETHATPAALIDSMFRTGGPTWAVDFLQDDLQEMTQILVLIIHHFFELWTLLVNVPPIDGEAWLDWFTRINAFMAKQWNVAVGLPSSAE